MKDFTIICFFILNIIFWVLAYYRMIFRRSFFKRARDFFQSKGLITEDSAIGKDSFRYFFFDFKCNRLVKENINLLSPDLKKEYGKYKRINIFINIVIVLIFSIIFFGHILFPQ